MFAIIRENTFDPQKLAEGRASLDQFQAIHAQQPGYRGTLSIDAGDGHWFTINLWDSPASAQAALPTMLPVVERLLQPLMAEPSRLLGTGTVVETDLDSLRD
jgi:hypothetical protein